MLVLPVYYWTRIFCSGNMLDAVNLLQLCLKIYFFRKKHWIALLISAGVETMCLHRYAAVCVLHPPLSCYRTPAIGHPANINCAILFVILDLLLVLVTLVFVCTVANNALNVSIFLPRLYIYFKITYRLFGQCRISMGSFSYLTHDWV